MLLDLTESNRCGEFAVDLRNTQTGCRNARFTLCSQYTLYPSWMKHHSKAGSHSRQHRRPNCSMGIQLYSEQQHFEPSPRSLR
jgi:hypothetical protein